MNQRSKILSWAFYDWANSAFSTTVLGVFLQTYVVAITPKDAPLQGPALWSFGVFVSALLSFLLSPILGAIADYTNSKKTLWTIFMLIGSLSTVAMFAITPNDYGLGVLLAITGSIGFSGSFVFYNAFLPEIASPDRRDQVSALGFALGYLGGGILLAANLVLVLSAGRLGLSTATATRISLTSAGLWWLVFALPMLVNIHDAPSKRAPQRQRVNVLAAGFRQLGHTLAEVRKLPEAFKFLVAFLLYNDGITTVIALSATFGAVELGLSQATIASVFLMVQFIAFAGSLAFGWFAQRVGAKTAIAVGLVIWTGIVTYAYLFIREAWQFWALGAAVGLVMGGTQAISRSLFSQIIPVDRSAEFFSFYEISDKASSIIGPLLFGIAFQLTGSVRTGVFALVVFFILGLLILLRVNVIAGVQEATATMSAHEQEREPLGVAAM
jgi:UMF1 family MFS transporter